MDSERVNESADLREWRRPVLRPISGAGAASVGTASTSSEFSSTTNIYAPRPS